MCSTNILHPTLPDSSITSSFFLFHYLFSGITMFWLCLKFVAFKFDIRLSKIFEKGFIRERIIGRKIQGFMEKEPILLEGFMMIL